MLTDRPMRWTIWQGHADGQMADGRVGDWEKSWNSERQIERQNVWRTATVCWCFVFFWVISQAQSKDSLIRLTLSEPVRRLKLCGMTNKFGFCIFLSRSRYKIGDLIRSMCMFPFVLINEQTLLPRYAIEKSVISETRERQQTKIS